MKARFKTTPVSVVFLEDLCNELGTMSITNDAEAVVEHVLKMYPGHRIFYRDTDGNWDELVHNGKAFCSFAPAPNSFRNLFSNRTVN
jgi:hypothetical protein